MNPGFDRRASTQSALRAALWSLFCFCFALTSSNALAAPDYHGAGDGHGGVLTVNDGEDVVVNDYVGLAEDLTAGSAAVVVDDAAAFASGDLILLWQAAGLADPGAGSEQAGVDLSTTDVGRFEFARVTGVDIPSNTLTLEASVDGDYPQSATQVVRVPEYSSVNIAATGSVSAAPFDGDVGGIVVFFVAGELANEGTISSTGAGFRGGTDRGNSGDNGCAQLNPANNSPAETNRTAQKGEGIVSERFGPDARGRSNVANAGGGGVCHNSGGGGGGHAGTGGQGGRTWHDDNDGVDTTTGRDVGGLGGAALTYDPSGRLTMGGGGGAGQMNDGYGGVGTSGGGVVLLRVGSLTGTGTLSANGSDGGDSTDPFNDAAGGAGAGGAIVVRAAGALSCGSVSADGGEGGSAEYDDHGPGGGGGGGYVLLQGESIACSATAAGGAAGVQTDLTDPAGPSYGAAAGEAGSSTEDPTPLGVDADGDGIPNPLEGPGDSDADGVADFMDADDDGDGIPSVVETNDDPDGDQIPNHLDLDSDEDGIGDAVEAFDDDGDGVQDILPLDNDHDGDGIDDQYDADCPAGAGCAGGSTTIVPDALTQAQDSDQDGVADWLESCVDGYVAASEFCDDGDADDTNACSNTCQANPGSACSIDADCFTNVCEAGICLLCRDDVSGGTDTGCDAANPICRDVGGSPGCTVCADVDAGSGIDEGCQAGAPQCDASAAMGVGACLGCATDADCDDGNACTSDSCDTNACINAPVTVGQACLDGQSGICDDTQTCVTGCTSDADCMAAAPTCDLSLTLPQCVECMSDGECDDGDACTTNACNASSCEFLPLTEGDTCLDGESGQCDATGACVAGCQSDADCGGSEPRCDDSTPVGVCVECLADADCDDGNACTSDSCAGGSCGTSAVAPGEPCLDGQTGTCSADQACLSEPDCQGAECATPPCETDADCEGGQACSPDGACAAGCSNDDDCPATQICDGGTCQPPDSDGDGVRDDVDPDDDNDGILDRDELRGVDLSTDRDGDGVADYLDADVITCIDDDEDLLCDVLHVAVDADGDGIPNHLDLDSDGDGVVDTWENGGFTLDTDADGRVDEPIDDDGDGLLAGFDDDDEDASVITTVEVTDTDGTGPPDHLDLDADGDGIMDVVEADGVDDDADGRQDGRDRDGNGIVDSVDPSEGGTPLDPVDHDDDASPSYQDTDSDSDGLGDATEGFDVDGDGNADTPPSGMDTDFDGLDDAYDPPDGILAPLPDHDDDGIADYLDADDDGDGTPTKDEHLDGPAETVDANGNGIADHLDPDVSTPVARAPVDDGDDTTDEPPPEEDGAESDAGATDAEEDERPTSGDAGADRDDKSPPNTSSQDAGASSADADVSPEDTVSPKLGVSGGAGCSTTRGNGDSWGWVVLLVLGLSVIRRGRGRLWLSGSLIVVSLGVTRQAIAQAAGFALDRYRPAETATDQFQISRPNDLGDGKTTVQALLDYANDPLVYESEAGSPDSEFAAAVAHHLVAHATFAYGVADRFVLYAGMPLNLVMVGDDVVGAPPADGTTLGDPWAGARVRLLGSNQDLIGLAAQGALSLPLAHVLDDEQAYAGNRSLTVHPELVFEVRPGHVRVTANVGTLLRNEAKLVGTAVGSEISYGLGFTMTPADAFEFLAELYGTSDYHGLLAREETPLELLIGGKIFVIAGLSMGLAAGPGLTRGVGSPDLRIVGNMAWITVPPKKTLAEIVFNPEPEDTDGDGIPDPDDACPKRAEDVDEFEDDDGCPEVDNDTDAIPDEADECPNEAEDSDEFEDEDGCPDTDNDQDGVPDSNDACPNEAEDVDGFADENGCPDPDNDGDSVQDSEDSCPMYAGPPSNAGCPTKIRVEGSHIVLLDGIEFGNNSDEILDRSEATLAEVHALLAGAPQLKKLRVEGHTDSRGADASNLELSRRRASAVRAWLVEAGIGAERLEAYGCGETRPIESNRTFNGRKANRRVEFHVLDPAPETPHDGTGCVPAD